MTDWLYRQCTYAYRSNQFGRTNMFRLMPIQSFGNCWQLLRPEQEILHSPEQITIARNGWCCWWPESDNFIATNLGMLFQFKSLLSNSTNDNVYVFYIHLQNQMIFGKFPSTRGAVQKPIYIYYIWSNYFASIPQPEAMETNNRASTTSGWQAAGGYSAQLARFVCNYYT